MLKHLKGRPRGCMIATGFLEFAPEHRELADESRDFRTQLRRQLRRLFARGVAEGELRSDANPDALARYFSAILQGLSVQARDGATVEELRAMTRTALVSLPLTR